jgi:hypothetical protein
MLRINFFNDLKQDNKKVFIVFIASDNISVFLETTYNF